MDPRINSALVGLIVTVIGLLGALIEIYGVKLVKARFTAKQIATAENIATIMVDAVEAMGAAGIIDYKGKFAEAFRRVKDMAAANGVAFSDAQWQSFIEAAVKAMKAMGEELHKAPAA